MTPTTFYALIGSVFGWSHEYGPRFHAGQDYPWGAGTKIPSPGAGRVVSRGYQLAAGYFVVILIDGKYFLFYHMKHWTDLQVGDVVAYGDTVGLVGSTGDSTGPHLHLAVSNSPIPGLGTRVDPRPIVESLLADHELAAGDQTPFPSIEEMEDEMLWIFYQPKNNSSPGTGGISRIWAGTREVGGILYADVWGVSPNGEARRLTRKHWVDLYRAAEKAQKPLTVIGCTGNELEQIVYARSL